MVFLERLIFLVVMTCMMQESLGFESRLPQNELQHQQQHPTRNVSFPLGEIFCNDTTTCVVINSCPFMLDLVKSGIFSKLNLVRENNCGFHQNNSKVCCHNENIVAEAPHQPKSRPFLPNQLTCGVSKALDRDIGNNLVPRGLYPWMVAMGYEVDDSPDLQFRCSGSLINNRYVLTAAHCAQEKHLKSRSLVLKVLHIGEWDLTSDIDCELGSEGVACSPTHIVAGVERAIIHPSFTGLSGSEDIALIKLNTLVTFTDHINPICIHSGMLDTKLISNRNKLLTATGWGLNGASTGNNLIHLLRDNVTLIDNKFCRDTDKKLCVKRQDSEICNVRSAPILMLRDSPDSPYYQVGLLSYGRDCSKSAFPDVYISVSEYLPWIQYQMES